MAKILCIEDEPELRRDLVEELEDAGHQPFEACNGVEGLRAILSLRPELVICDVSMPEMSGVELFRFVRRDFPSLSGMRFVFLSAFDDVAEQFDAQMQPDGFITKPVNYDQLLSVVRTQCDNMGAICAPMDSND